MLLKNTLFGFTLLVGMAYLVSEVLPGSKGFPSNQVADDFGDIQSVAKKIDQEFEDHWKKMTHRLGATSSGRHLRTPADPSKSIQVLVGTRFMFYRLQISDLFVAPCAIAGIVTV